MLNQHALPLSANSFRALSEAERAEIIADLTEEEALVLLYDWGFWAREQQLAPKGDWTNWLILAGRGFGKTRTGAEWVRSLVEQKQASRIAIIAPTAADARDTMVEGESGLIAISPPWNRPSYEPSKRRLTWPNGAMATLFSADEPERLRGPQHDAAWCDELCAWRYADAAWDMLAFGLRLGDHPRTCITTTPKPTKLLKRLMTNPCTNITKGTTYDNLDNLAGPFREIIKAYEGTRLGRQELNAEILSDLPGALWSRDMFDQMRLQEAPTLNRIIIAVDPPVSTGEKADECGIIAAGTDDRGLGYVLSDYSAQGLSPTAWASRAVAAYHEMRADRVVAEVNQGGDMVETIMRQIDPSVPFRAVRATRGKTVRAEPISALYERGLVHHVGTHPELEDQMCAFTSDFDKSRMGYSPDRVDALVWALTDLMMKQTSSGTLRKL